MKTADEPAVDQLYAEECFDQHAENPENQKRQGEGQEQPDGEHSGDQIKEQFDKIHSRIPSRFCRSAS